MKKRKMQESKKIFYNLKIKIILVYKFLIKTIKNSN